MNASDIAAEYARLGYDLGWTFMMTPAARLHDARVCLVGLNPGGREPGEATWSCEHGNAYHAEKWAACGRDYSGLQLQIHEMERILGLDPNGYLAAQYIPFRSGDWDSLGNREAARAFGKRLWAWVLTISPATLFICLGNEASEAIADLVGAGQENLFPTLWGKATIGQRLTPDRARVVVRLPHLSSYKIFGRAGCAGEIAAASLLSACAR